MKQGTPAERYGVAVGRWTFAGRASISFVCVADCARPFGLGFAERRGHSCLERFALFLPNAFACELSSTSIRSESASLGFWERRTSSFCSCACFLNREPLKGFFMLSGPGSATSISLAEGFDFLVELMLESLAILFPAECFGTGRHTCGPQPNFSERDTAELKSSPL